MNVVVNGFKAAWIIFWAVIATAVLGTLEIITAFMGRTGSLAFRVTWWWSWFLMRIAGVRAELRGGEHAQPGQSYVLAANHSSLYDIPALTSIIRLGIQYRWVIKKELFYVPLFGQALYLARHVFIDRSNRQKAVSSIRRGVERLPAGVSLLFFPEGTRSRDGLVGPFKRGAFVTAIETGLPILPLTVNGAHKILPRGRFAFNPGTMEVVVGRPIETQGYTRERADELMERVRQAVVANHNPDFPEKRE